MNALFNITKRKKCASIINDFEDVPSSSNLSGGLNSYSGTNLSSGTKPFSGTNSSGDSNPFNDSNPTTSFLPSGVLEPHQLKFFKNSR